MRTSKREQLANAERKAIEAKRSTVSKSRKAKRKEKGKAEDIARAIRCSPAGMKACSGPEREEGSRKEARSSQLSEDASEGRSGNRRKMKADSGRATWQPGSVKATG